MNEMIYSIQVQPAACIPGQVPERRSAADRRHPVSRRQGRHAGGVLLYVRLSLRGAPPDRGDERQGSQGDPGSRGAARLALQPGSRHGHQGARISRRASPSSSAAQTTTAASFSNEVALRIASQVRGNVRDLEGVLVRLTAITSLAGTRSLSSSPTRCCVTSPHLEPPALTPGSHHARATAERCNVSRRSRCGANAAPTTSPCPVRLRCTS